MQESFLSFLGDNLQLFLTYTGVYNATPGHIIMILVGLLFIFLAIKYEFEPMLLIPIGFGILIGNIPFKDAGLQVGIYEQGSVLNILYQGVTSGWYPPLIFLGIGAMTDFSALISNPKLMLIGAAAQFGIFEVFMDTIVICTITALAVLASGVWTQEGLSSGQLALAAFQSVFGNFGAIFVAITVFMFVFSTIISAGFFGQIQAEILFGRKFSKIWVFMYPLFIGIACAFSNVTTMYMITDGFMAIIVILNMIGLLLMCKQVKDLQKEYYNTPGMYYLADKAAKEAKKAAK